jgi:hypothetical protein
LPDTNPKEDYYPEYIKNSKNKTPKEQIIQTINGRMS